MEKNTKINRYMFGLGTVGRDMQYSLVSLFLMFYLTDILNLPDSTMWRMTGALLILRIFDAVNDPFMGFLVDNTRGRFGKFKPWIAIGGVLGGIFTILLFTDFGLEGEKYVISFVVLYLLWDLTYGANDIAYWSMLPSLSIDPRERERIGSVAKICANIGMYLTVIAIIPITNALGGDTRAWQVIATIIVLIMLAFLSFPLFGVKEEKRIQVKDESTSPREMFQALFKNDQLKWTAIAMALFMIGYVSSRQSRLSFQNNFVIVKGLPTAPHRTVRAVFPHTALLTHMYWCTFRSSRPDIYYNLRRFDVIVPHPLEIIPFDWMLLPSGSQYSNE